MVIRQTLQDSTPHTPRRSQGAPIAIGASIAVHVAIGGYLLSITFHPFNPPTPAEDPPRPWETVTLQPAQPAQPVPPLTRAHPLVRAASGPVETTFDPLPVTPTLVDPGPTTLPMTGDLEDGPGAGPAPQSEGPRLITNPEWLSRPTADQVNRAYPEDAIREGVGGLVVLACRVSDFGAVKPCDVVSESPAGYRFGKAALGLSRYFRMKPRMENGRPVGDQSVRIPIRFVLSGG